MMQRFASMAVALGTLSVLSVAGCTSYQVHNATQESAVTRAERQPATDFIQQLGADYAEFSAFKEYQFEWPMTVYDYKDTGMFAKKARKAADGMLVQPETPGNWKLSTTESNTANAFYNRLTGLLDDGGRTEAPAYASRAQVMYDCMLERMEADRTNKAEFCSEASTMAAIDNLEAVLTKTVSVAKKPYAPAQKERVIILPDVLEEIYFGHDSATVENTAMRIVKDLANASKVGKTPRVAMVGYADRSGPSDYNMKLSMKRAEAVRTALIKAGFPAHRIAATAVGENELVVPTEDGVREPKNRVVKIHLVRD